MIGALKRFFRDDNGAGAIEMAIAAPVLVMFIYGIFAFGQILEADAGMQNALGQGARYATLCLNPSSTGTCTNPTDTQITTKVTGALFGPASGITPTITTDAANNAKTITLTYSQQMNFLFFTGPTVTFTRSKVVYYAH
jgi:Flp pilus assembly protein TadG